jgi:hypothetical protein
MKHLSGIFGLILGESSVDLLSVVGFCRFAVGLHFGWLR